VQIHWKSRCFIEKPIWENVRNVLSGKAELILDTAVIAIPELEEIKD